MPLDPNYPRDLIGYGRHPVQANWPGLAAGRLFENRDLQPTADLRAVAKGVLAQHMGLGTQALDVVFPDSRPVGPMASLIG